jgi:hypothetical protein
MKDYNKNITQNFCTGMLTNTLDMMIITKYRRGSRNFQREGSDPVKKNPPQNFFSHSITRKARERKKTIAYAWLSGPLGRRGIFIVPHLL